MKTKTIIVILLMLLVLIFGGFLVKLLMFAPTTINQSIDMAYDVNQETLDGKNAIYTYEWFKNREGEIKALYKKEERAKQQVDDFLEMFPNKDNWTREDKNEYSRLRSNLTATGNMLDSAIESYNAESSKVNKAIFKDNLPANLNRAYFTGKNLRDN